MEISLAGQVAIVTGGGRGLGRTYALDLARHGAKVVVNDNGADLNGRGEDHGPADSVVAEIKAAGGEAVASYDSVASYEGGYNIVKTAIDTWGRLDAVVCNAGMLRDAALHNMGEDDWDTVLGIHLKGCYTLVRHAWPVFRQASYGRVVFATSASGLWGNFGQSNYASAKAGMIGLMNVTKLEGAKYNILVNLVGPVAATRMTMALMPEDRQKMMRPELVAPAVTYLCSPQNTESGIIIEAGGGGFNRASLVKSKGVNFDPNTDVDAGWFGDHWAEITDITGAPDMWNMADTRAKHAADVAGGAQAATKNTI
ncbi:MAG: SDR family NAD(P)-dependent oxidoreductase [Dehalococcoidia bacterium]|nr:SDR family NAD(P)-dependent oxidoreductase [Dehalococcoidia bacterium]